MRYVLSQEAELDLLEIYEYSLEEWDEGQAVAYLDGLYDAFAGLTAFSKKEGCAPISVWRFEASSVKAT